MMQTLESNQKKSVVKKSVVKKKKGVKKSIFSDKLSKATARSKALSARAKKRPRGSHSEFVVMKKTAKKVDLEGKLQRAFGTCAEKHPVGIKCQSCVVC